eukprot:3939168-Rhodomonas_salina.2
MTCEGVWQTSSEDEATEARTSIWPPNLQWSSCVTGNSAPTTVTAVPPAVEPLEGRRDNTVIGVTNRYSVWVPESADVASRIRETLAAPAGCDGETQRTLVLDSNVPGVAVSSKLQPSTSTPKFTPITMISVPPAAVPELGVTVQTTGSDTIVTLAYEVEKSCPLFETSTVTFADPELDAGTVQVMREEDCQNAFLKMRPPNRQVKVSSVLKDSPATVIRTPPPAGTDSGSTIRMVTGAWNQNGMRDSRFDAIPLPTPRSTSPCACLGVWHATWVLVIARAGTGMAPNRHIKGSEVSKNSPTTVTAVPPVAGPIEGATATTITR